jgi:hypothetical protein
MSFAFLFLDIDTACDFLKDMSNHPVFPISFTSTSMLLKVSAFAMSQNILITHKASIQNTLVSMI